MHRSNHRILLHARRSLLLWGCGWRRRRFISCSRPVVEWQDPDSGMWLREDAAVRVAWVQARRSGDRRERQYRTTHRATSAFFRVIGVSITAVLKILPKSETPRSFSELGSALPLLAAIGITPCSCAG